LLRIGFGVACGDGGVVGGMWIVVVWMEGVSLMLLGRKSDPKRLWG